ncbi:hypothetical protein MILUP08_45066 [Micromonospora lupini str. Lupac 08]|uniref:Uncharacterized protein n=1 Tax=Micromonospora lupini str. Lupac 08 TaxID=1150864 RepID=I0L8N9_9ACTN|nr:hypothetical protein MILUP08_45066 [Micromonospora lupini str. Lupac 08]
MRHIRRTARTFPLVKPLTNVGKKV